MFSAQTRARSPRDTLDRLERATPHSDHERPRIEGRLNFDFHTGAVEPKMAVDQDAGASGGGLIAIGAGAVLALGLIAGAFLFINVEQ